MQQRPPVQGSYLLPPPRGAPPGATLREPAPAPSLKITDPAVRAMSDFRQDAAQTVGEELQLERALDQMFRQGVRALLAVRDGAVTGLITVEQAQAAAHRQRSAHPQEAAHPQGDAHPQGAACRVADAMIPVMDVPAIDWQVIEASQVRDLVEIFEGSGAHHLVVVENHGTNLASIRGLVHRDRLERQLGALWAASVAARGRAAS